jgi:hypothetical protein
VLLFYLHVEIQTTGMDDYVASSDYRCPLFQFFYEWICEDFDLLSSANLGTIEHMKFVFSLIKSAKVFRGKNMKVKKSRWMSVWDSLDVFMKHWSIYALILAWVCIRYGIVKSLDELLQGPVFTPAVASPEPEPAASAKAKSAPISEPSREVRHSNKEADNMRQKARNTLHLCALIVCNRFKRGLAVGLKELMQVCRIRFKMMFP